MRSDLAKLVETKQGNNFYLTFLTEAHANAFFSIYDPNDMLKKCKVLSLTTKNLFIKP